MAKDLNKVQLTGYLGADPEMRYTAQGSAVTTYRVASGRTWKDRDGNQHDDTEWFRVVAWDKLGEICNQYLSKGTRVYVEGRLQTRKWTDREGQERYTSEVISQDMIILSSRNGERNNGNNDSQVIDDDMGEEQEEEQSAPTTPTRRPARTNSRASSGSSRNQPQPIESDDDIPF